MKFKNLVVLIHLLVVSSMSSATEVCSVILENGIRDEWHLLKRKVLI